MANKKATDSITVKLKDDVASQIHKIFTMIVSDLTYWDKVSSYIAQEDTCRWMIKQTSKYMYQDKVTLRLSATKAKYLHGLLKMIPGVDADLIILMEELNQFLMGYELRLKSRLAK